MRKMKIHRGNFESNLLFLDETGLLDTPKRILEIGAGRGVLTRVLKDRGHQIIGTEINHEYIAFAKEENDVDLVFTNVETTDLPFPDKSFDFVISFDVFEHIPDSDAHLKEVSRVLAPGGSYLLCTPNKLTNVPFEILKEKSLTKYKEYHIALHTFWGLKKRLQKNGYQTSFVSIPLVTPYFIDKMRRYTGSVGVFLVHILKPDAWPQFLKTNFYVVAKKQEEV